MTLQEKFKHIYCINLDRRSDRWKESLVEFEKLDLYVKRFPACDGRIIGDLGYGPVYNGEFAGTVSHTDVLTHAKMRGLESILVIEDDITFASNFQEVWGEVQTELPENWDILFFGGNHTGGYTPYSKNLIRTYGSYALQCYAVNSKAYEKIISFMNHCIDEVLTTEEKYCPSVAADFFMAKTHPHLNVYSIHPNITWQRESFSDLQQDTVFYDFLKP